jgi:hypothetical protein
MALDEFSPCGSCARHVKRGAARCPFCDAAITNARGSGSEWRWTGATRATLFAAALAGCDRFSAAPAPSAQRAASEATGLGLADASVDAAVAEDAAVNALVDDAGLLPALLGLAYGAPPPMDLREGPPMRGRIAIGDVDSESPQSGQRELRVTRVLRAQLPGIRACYERGLRSNPTLAGALSVRFAIGANGRVSEASATGLPSDPSVAACVAARVRGVVFPSPEGGAAEVFAVNVTLEPQR